MDPEPDLVNTEHPANQLDQNNTPKMDKIVEVAQIEKERILANIETDPNVNIDSNQTKGTESKIKKEGHKHKKPKPKSDSHHHVSSREKRRQAGTRSRNGGRVRPGSRQMMMKSDVVNEVEEERKSIIFRVFFILFVAFTTWIVMSNRSNSRRYRTRFSKS